MDERRSLTPILTPLGAWAFSIGTSMGWGALVVTSTTHLAQAGPWGSLWGMLLGGVVMIVIASNYAYMMNIFPDSGGAYTFTRETLGHDYSFLTAWFLSLTYLAILWANITSIPLFARYFIGDLFKRGFLYRLFDYDVYLGEALLSVGMLMLAGLLCARHKGAAARAMSAMALIFSVAITVCFCVTISRHGMGFDPAFSEDGLQPLGQVVKITVISPWAFIGFENISHSMEEIRFRRTLLHRVLLISVICTTALYIFVTLLSATAYPPEYGSWLEYIRDCGNLSGLKGLPAFYAAHHYMGDAGVRVLIAALLALIGTSLIGNLTAVSRLFLALGRDGVMPERYAALNGHGAPGKAIALAVGVSVVFPFLGRTAISWIVDVTTIGATLVYGLVSVAVVKLARERRDGLERVLGMAGVICMILFGVFTLAPNLFVSSSIASAAYILFVRWSVLGCVVFRFLLKRDSAHRFGSSIVVWIALFSMILLIMLIFLFQSVMDATGAGLNAVEAYYARPGMDRIEPGLVEAQFHSVRRVSAVSVSVTIALIAVSLGMLISNFRMISNRALSSERQLGMVREMASRDPLTGVKSRHAYSEKERELDERIANGSTAPFAIAVCDLNGLKFYNDEYGHQAGDERIKQACKVICDLFNHSPVYRNGGDEFVVCLTGRDFEDRQTLMETLHQRSAGNIGTGDVVISGGLSEYQPGKDTRMRAVFERADAAMYREKMLLKEMGAKTR